MPTPSDPRGSDRRKTQGSRTVSQNAVLRNLGGVSLRRQQDVVNELDESSTVGRNFTLLVPLSCVIATFGLVQNSPAVIIGAMLIAPLMSLIIAFSLALVLGDLGRDGRSLLTRAVVVAVPDGVVVQQAGAQVAAVGTQWIEVVLPDGQVERVAQQYLVPYHNHQAP